MHNLLETERLRLREFTTADTAFIIQLLNSPGWLQFIGDRHVQTDAQALDYLRNGPFRSYQQRGFGLWLVEQKDNAEAIGMAGLIQRDYLDRPDLGFAFLPELQGKGYAFEIAAAIVHYAKAQLALPPLAAIVMPANTRSIRLLEKLGFRFTRNLSQPDTGEELRLYHQVPDQLG